jgi:SAM-dependent methyltransferase
VLLDALCAKNLLTKSNWAYHLSPTSETYLIRRGHGYCVPIFLAWFQAREKFISFVKTGNATLDLTLPEADEIWASYASPDRVRLPELVGAAHKRWADSGIPSRIYPGAHILDLGCGSGFKGFTLLQMDSAAHITCIDSSKVLEITREVAELMGVSSRVFFQDGNVERELPQNTFDVVLFGNLLHYFDPASATGILQKARQALKPGGILVIYSKAVDEERKEDAALLSMIDVSNCAPHGQHFTFSEYKGMLEAAGFRDAEQSKAFLISAVK